MKSLTEDGLLFQGILAESLEAPNKFPPNFFSQLVKAADEGMTHTILVIPYESYHMTYLN